MFFFLKFCFLLFLKRQKDAREKLSKQPIKAGVPGSHFLVSPSDMSKTTNLYVGNLPTNVCLTKKNFFLKPMNEKIIFSPYINSNSVEKIESLHKTAA